MKGAKFYERVFRQNNTSGNLNTHWHISKSLYRNSKRDFSKKEKESQGQKKKTEVIVKGESPLL